jgi:hypothetical protein
MVVPNASSPRSAGAHLHMGSSRLSLVPEEIGINQQAGLDWIGFVASTERAGVFGSGPA